MAQCPECGREVVDGTRFCFCGIDLALPPIPPPRGVGGWLLFFCIQTTILAPLVTAVNVLVVVLALVGGAGPPLRGKLGTFVAFNLALGVVVAGVGMYAGVRLWSLSPGALRVARAYLVLLGGVAVMQGVLPGVLGMPKQTLDDMVAHSVMLAIATAGSAAFWWLYLSHSRRVKATFDESST